MVGENSYEGLIFITYNWKSIRFNEKNKWIIQSHFSEKKLKKSSKKINYEYA